MKYLKIKDIIVNTSPEKVPVGTTPYIEIGDIDIFNKTYQHKDKKSVSGAKYALKDSIIVSTVRPTRGAISIIKEEKITVSNAFAIINVDKEQCNFKYLFYMINSNKFYQYLGSNSKGATYPTCSREDVYNYEIALPSLDEQNKIVKIFDNISNSIIVKKQQVFKLEQLIKSQFIKMFEKNNDYKTFKLEEIGYMQTGGTPSRKNNEYFKGNINWFTAGELNSLFINDSIEKITVDALEHSSAKLFKENSLLIGMYDTAAMKMGILKHEAASNQVCTNFYPKDNNVNIIWLYYYLNHHKEDLLNERKGIRQKNISLAILKNYSVKLYSIMIQNKFANIVKRIDKQKYEFEKQLEKLKELQESLMKEYFG